MPSEQQLLQDVLELITQGRNQEALGKLEGFRPDERFRSSFEYAKAMVYCRMGRQGEGASILTGIVEREPGFLDAGKVLGQLRSEGYPGDWTAPSAAAASPAAAIASAPAAPASGIEYYGKQIVNPSTLVNIATAAETWSEILSFHGGLATDDYVAYLDRYYREGVRRFGPHWHYLDAVNVIYAAAKAVKPARYLEIGVRRGRSVCAAARACPGVDIFAFDMWIAGYAGMDNPGPSFVKQELARHGHRGSVEFVDGNSHETLPRFFRERPGLLLDMITVDGDHTEAGAADDLAQVIPRLAPGGVLVMDDIAHPAHPYLLKVWKDALAAHPELVSHEFTELGYGVAFAVKKG